MKRRPKRRINTEGKAIAIFISLVQKVSREKKGETERERARERRNCKGKLTAV